MEEQTHRNRGAAQGDNATAGVPAPKSASQVGEANAGAPESAPQRPAPKVPPAAPPSTRTPTPIKPRLRATPPGAAPRPKGPEPIQTPNLWGNETELYKSTLDPVESILNDPDLQKDDPRIQRRKVGGYIVACLAVMAAAAVLVMLLVAGHGPHY